MVIITNEITMFNYQLLPTNYVVNTITCVRQAVHVDFMIYASFNMGRLPTFTNEDYSFIARSGAAHFTACFLKTTAHDVINQIDEPFTGTKPFLNTLSEFLGGYLKYSFKFAGTYEGIDYKAKQLEGALSMGLGYLFSDLGVYSPILGELGAGFFATKFKGDLKEEDGLANALNIASNVLNLQIGLLVAALIKCDSILSEFEDSMINYFYSISGDNHTKEEL